MSNRRRKPNGRGGFTLLELVIVVGILVILAGMVLPNLDIFKQKANKGVSAANMADLSRNIQQFYAQNSRYPDRWDSLLQAGGTLWPSADLGIGTPGLDPELAGGVGVDPPEGKLDVTTLDDDGYVRSVTRMGITTVLDLDSASTDAPSNRFTVARPLANGEKVATIRSTAAEIIEHLYPQTKVVPTDKKLVVLGIGKQNTMVGQSVMEVPLYSNRDTTVEYGRYLAVFEADKGGSPAKLKAVIGADGDLIEGEIGEYYEK